VELFFDVATLVKDTVVEIVFKNDASRNGEDRNLAVQSIKVNGDQVLDAAGSGVVFDQGVGAQAFDGLNTVPSANTGGWMPWDSAMRFKLPDLASGGGQITVRAAATLAAGVGAQIELRLNGVLMGSRLVSSTAPSDFVFTTPVVAAGDRIDVVFTNDALLNGQDRNLYVESVTARGVVMPAAAAGVTIDQGSGPQAFDGQGVVAASTYGGWVPWNAALRLAAR
jgi:Ca-dependent carbohydrate-binding module xylan-binding